MAIERRINNATYTRARSLRGWFVIGLVLFVLISIMDLDRRHYNATHGLQDLDLDLSTSDSTEDEDPYADDTGNPYLPSWEAEEEDAPADPAPPHKLERGAVRPAAARGKAQHDSGRIAKAPGASGRRGRGAAGGAKLPPSGQAEDEEDEEDEEAQGSVADRVASIAGQDTVYTRGPTVREPTTHKAKEVSEGQKREAAALRAEARRGAPVCQKCNFRGHCRPDGRCGCGAIWRGERCSEAGWVVEQAGVSFTAAFEDEFAMTAHSLGNQTAIMGAPDTSPKGTGKPVKIMDVTRAMLRALPLEDPTFDVIYRSCAVVGNSGVSLMYEKGGEIDEREAVLRFNNARTVGFEQHVGSRTTLRFTSRKHFAFRENSAEIVLQFVRHPVAMIRMLETKRKKPALKLYGVNPDFQAYLDRTFAFAPSAGLTGIVFALHKCAQVYLYGFHVQPRHGAQYHYFEEDAATANEPRDEVEWEVVKALADGGLLHFADPCIVECHTSELWCESCQASLVTQNVTVSR